MPNNLDNLIKKAAKALKRANYAITFTGAGISVESGIPPFRGPTGLWSKYSPTILDLYHFKDFPEESWPTIKEIFYDYWETAKPNPAHYGLAELETKGIIKEIITQNIDNLHQKAGSKRVHEFHGTLKTLTCMECYHNFKYDPILLKKLPASCPDCHGLLKPNFVFFSEAIPEQAKISSIEAIVKVDLILVIGTLGEVMPACQLPYLAKKTNNATIIEINIEESNFTRKITDIFLKGKAGEILPKILNFI
ncbi:Sir2 family NAD-dependent protein deacetylase [Candidatus Lokiarchaeum ossiferum]|uniref:Sir2 family NAD-dependent protein deacetylase n=1 Tax=Candidatus Lokiarchaeum ossiferum TaxID=2951803 RepID=UPI00352E93F5